VQVECKITNKKLANYINEEDAQKLAKTDKEIMSLYKLMLQMEKGWDLSLYPLPTCSNHESPKEK
jgi:nitrogen fixation protein